MYTPPATSDQAVPRRARRKQARPGELLDAALDLFVEKGFAATRVEEVAHHAGVSKGTLFLYFSSKEELFKAVVRHNLSGQFPQNRAAVFWGIAIETPGTPVEVWWKFFSGANVKQIFMLQELLSFENPRAVTRQAPTYGASDLINLVLGVVANQPVVDVFLTLWAEPTATTITSGALQA